MIRNVVSIETEVGVRKFALHCENGASLMHCLEAVKFFENYIQERIKQAEQPVPESEVKAECDA